MKEIRKILQYIKDMNSIKHADIAVYTKRKTVITLHIDKVVNDIMLVNADIHSCLTGACKSITVEEAIKQISKYKKVVRSVTLNNHVYGSTSNNWTTKYQNIDLNYILFNAS